MNAIEIWTKDKQYKLGYVPAIYSRYVDKLVTEGEYQAVIEEVNSNGDPYNIVNIKKLILRTNYINRE